MFWKRRDKYADLRANIEYLDKRLKERIDEVEEDLIILNKICSRKQIKIISKPCFVFSLFDGSSAHNDEKMEEDRNKARAEGYSFCHTKKCGDEVWMKD